MVAQKGMNMFVSGYIDQGNRQKKIEEWALLVRKAGSGVTSGEKMDNSVNFRGIADVTHLHLQIKKIFKTVHVNGKGRPVRKVIDKGVDF